jgi:hypothetical protein
MARRKYKNKMNFKEKGFEDVAGFIRVKTETSGRHFLPW